MASADNWVDRVKKEADIVGIISHHVSLRQSGKNYSGLCPFHSEKTPSFSVNAEKRFFYCFGCKVGGSVIDFVARIEGIGYREAAEHVAKTASIEVPVQSPAEKEMLQVRDSLWKVNRLAARFFYAQLRKGPGQAGLNYLLQARGLDQDVLDRFFIGYAPPQGDGLVKYLQSKSASLTDAEQAGLVLANNKGSGFFDRFRHRIMFPICDSRGRFLGFGGRTVGEGRPKYLNSPETPVFRKGSSLYGINVAKDAIRKQKKVVVTEGYTDCLRLNSCGLSNVVATLGTAFSADHGRLLQRLAPQIILAYDGDEAGETGIETGFSAIKDLGITVRVATVPDGMDPDQFGREKSLEELEAWVQQSVPLTEYRLRKIVETFDISDREEKVQAANAAVAILKDLKNTIEQNEYITYTAELMGLEVNLVDEAVKKTDSWQVSAPRNTNKYTGRATNSHKPVKIRNTNKHLPARTPIETAVMYWLIKHPAAINELIAIGIEKDSFSNPDYGHLFALLRSGTWDKHGEAVKDKIFSLGAPCGQWPDYLRQFETSIHRMELQKIKEKAGLMPNSVREGDSIQKLCRLILRYYRVTRCIQETNQPEGGVL